MDLESALSPDTDLMQQWRKMFEDRIDLIGPYQIDKDVSEAFWRTLVADIIKWKRVAADPEFFAPSFNRWHSGEGEPLRHTDVNQSLNPPDFLPDFLSASLHKRLFISDKGYLGLATSPRSSWRLDLYFVQRPNAVHPLQSDRFRRRPRDTTEIGAALRRKRALAYINRQELSSWYYGC